MGASLKASVALSEGRVAFGPPRAGYVDMRAEVPIMKRWADALRAVEPRDVVIEHQLRNMTGEEVRAFLAGCLASMAPGGALIVGEPDAAHPSAAYQAHLSKTQPKSMFRAAELIALLQEIGFVDVALAEGHLDGVFLAGASDGPARLINRSSLNDKRHQGALAYSSLVVAARAPEAAIVGVRDFFGYEQSRRLGRPVDLNGDPVPWITYPAIAYLKQLDLSDAAVFEYGSGASTLYWARRARRVSSVEHHAGWFEKISATLPQNCRLRLAEGAAYASAIADGAPYDVVIVDGRWRFDCAMAAIDHVTPDGLIILDNSERYPTITQKLRDAGFLQVDFIGNGPTKSNPWATSFFFRRGFQGRPAGAHWPDYAPGFVDAYALHPGLAEVNKQGAR